MSLRDLLKKERLKIQLALSEAKSAGLSRGGILGSMGGLGLRGNLGSRLLATRGADIGMPQSPVQEQQAFQPKVPILGIFLQGSRPIRETISSLILSTQEQPQPHENPGPSMNPQIVQCPQCGAEVLESFDYCPNCATILKQLAGQESRSLSVQA